VPVAVARKKCATVMRHPAKKGMPVAKWMLMVFALSIPLNVWRWVAGKMENSIQPNAKPWDVCPAKNVRLNRPQKPVATKNKLTRHGAEESRPQAGFFYVTIKPV
jgi:hypothetical protein